MAIEKQENMLPKFLAIALQKSLETMYEEEFKLFSERIKSKKAEIIASIVLNVEKHTSYATLGDIVRIEINTKEIK